MMTVCAKDKLREHKERRKMKMKREMRNEIVIANRLESSVDHVQHLLWSHEEAAIL